MPQGLVLARFYRLGEGWGLWTPFFARRVRNLAIKKITQGFPGAGGMVRLGIDWYITLQRLCRHQSMLHLTDILASLKCLTALFNLISTGIWVVFHQEFCFLPVTFLFPSQLSPKFGDFSEILMQNKAKNINIFKIAARVTWHEQIFRIVIVKLDIHAHSFWRSLFQVQWKLHFL